MTLPEGWPTLQEIMRATAHLANGDAPDWHVNYRLTNAASFAVTAYPALVALRDQLDSWAQVAAAQQECANAPQKRMPTTPEQPCCPLCPACTRDVELGRTFRELWKMGAPWPVRRWTCTKHDTEGCLACKEIAE